MSSKVNHNGTPGKGDVTLTIHDRPTHLNTTGSPASSPITFSQADQLKKVHDTMRARDVKIAVISSAFSPNPDQDKARMTRIATELNKILSGSKALVYEYHVRNYEWFAYLRSVNVNYYIFINFPPVYGDRTPESAFFYHRSPRIVEVVVVRSDEWSLPSITLQARKTASMAMHYLEKFLQLEGSDRDVATMSLCHFSLSQPVPSLMDKAYWSGLPKVIQMENDQNSLGLVIITREMAPKSQYPQIVLVKSFKKNCREELRKYLGKYTHIQSYNGILLDSLDIGTVTSIISSASTSKKLQLVVRYIHPIKTDTSTEGGLSRGISTILTPITPMVRPSTEKIETLPIPLMILGDVHVRCRELFGYLSGEGSLCNFSNSEERITTITSTTATSTTSRKTSEPYLSVPSHVARSETSGSGCDSMEGSDNDYVILGQPNNYISRSRVPSGYFNSSSSPITPIRGPNLTSQQSHTYPQTNKQYIVTMFKQDMDRRFAHLFLRKSGIYIMVVSLDDAVDDPLIHFENLLFWVRLVHGYVGPYGMKRIIIVAMANSILTPKMNECLKNFEGAIREANFPNIHNDRHGKFIVLFNQQNVKASIEFLCQAISRCMDLMMSRAWHFDPPFFKNVFQPFVLLNEVLCSISFSEEITMSSDSLLSLCKYADSNYFDTLEAYSSAAINLTQNFDSLLKPSFMIELLKKLTLDDEYAGSFFHLIPQVQDLPVVLRPWPIAKITAINSDLAEHQQGAIIKWAERYELLYSLGYHDNHEVFFIPLLATEFQSEVNCSWPLGEDEEMWYNQHDVTFLYARLNFFAIYHFFYLLLAVVLKDIIAGGGEKCYIKSGCMEAIVPVSVQELGTDIKVYLKYHVLQNVVEFRTESKNKQLYLYYAANNKLKAAFSQSIHRNNPGGYDKAVNFCIPGDKYSSSLKNSSLGKLCSLQEEDEGELDHDQPLKMSEVTDSLLKEWESSKKEAKQKIPSDNYIHWGRQLSSDGEKWADVGSYMKLFRRDEVDYFRNNPLKEGNGSEVLKRWCNSNTLTYKDLTNSLTQSGLEVLADEIDSYFVGTEV